MGYGRPTELNEFEWLMVTLQMRAEIASLGKSIDVLGTALVSALDRIKILEDKILQGA